MSNITDSIYNMGLLDELSKKKTSLVSIHPLVKVLTTLFYLVIVVSFERYEINGLIPLVFYPILIFTIGEIPIIPIVKRVLIAMPFIIGVGIVNLFFEKGSVLVAGIYIPVGWITFMSIVIKGLLTITATVLLIAITGMDKLAMALRMIKIPKIFVMQLLLTYRYIAILIEEVSIMTRAYSLRAPRQKGINIKEWGSFAGQLLLRTYDRAQRIYEAMILRGFNGEYNTGNISIVKIRDYTYFVVWTLFFCIAKFINIPMLIERIISGVIR